MDSMLTSKINTKNPRFAYYYKTIFKNEKLKKKRMMLEVKFMKFCENDKLPLS